MGTRFLKTEFSDLSGRITISKYVSKGATEQRSKQLLKNVTEIFYVVIYNLKCIIKMLFYEKFDNIIVYNTIIPIKILFKVIQHLLMYY